MEYAGVTVPDDDRQAVGGWGDIRPMCNVPSRFTMGA